MSRRHNTLLLMSDQHHPRILGCRGDEVVRTPALDALAARGTLFTQAYCGNPLCVPSRMSFLTGRHGSDIHVWSNQCRLAAEIPTFLHGLTVAGYETILCGRMHFVGPDQRHGFESRLLGDVDARLDPIPLSTTGQTKAAVETAGPGRTAYLAYDEAVTATACEWLRGLPRRPADRPWCLVVGYVLPHCPYICPREWFEEYNARIEVPEVPAGYLDSLHPALRQWRATRGVDDLSTEQRRVARAAYYGLVTCLDRLIGHVLAALGESGAEADTRVVYTSDHGDMAGELGMWWKSSFYDGSVGVPLLWKEPGLQEGRECRRNVSLLDIGPTLLDLAGAPPLPGARGRSLRPLLEDRGTSSWPDEVFAEYAGLQGDPPARMIRRRRWKLNHYHGFAEPQLFDLEADPAELHDLAHDAGCADLRDELVQVVRKDWSGEHIAHVMSVQDAQRRLLRDWSDCARTQKNPPPDRWTAPAGCNVFPE